MSSTLSWGIAYALAAVVLYLVTRAIPALKDLPIGADKRVSTSKVQFWVWMYAIVFALLAMLLAWGLGRLGWADADVGKAFRDFRNEGLDETYLLLLGLPAGAAIGAKAITTTKIGNGTIDKTDKAPGDKTSPLTELVSDDDGKGDLGDAQYMLFNLVALLYFAVQFLVSPESGLPNMPDTLVGLTGVAAGAYVTKKGVYREPPVLLALDPPAQRPGASVTVRGEKLTAKGGDASDASNVVFGVQPARLTPVACTVVVPASLDPGPVKVRVVRPPGAESEQLDFTVLDPKPVIGTVRPGRLVLGTDDELVITGRGFLSGRDQPAESNALLLDGRPLAADDWTDVRVRSTLPTDDAGIRALQIEAGTLELVVVAADGTASDSKSISVATTVPLAHVTGSPP